MSPDTGGGQQGSSGAVLDPTMSLVGRLEDLSLGEILQIVSLSKRSGLLRLEGPGGKANMYIKAGKVIYASSSDEKEGVLGMLLETGALGEDQAGSLRRLLESGTSTPNFRSVLAQETGMTPDVFQGLLRKRVEELVYSLFLWEEGTFSFQLIEDETTHPLLSRVGPFFLDDGVGAQFLVMEGARLKDEMNREMPAAPVTTEGFPGPEDWEQEFEEQLAGQRVEAPDVPEAPTADVQARETPSFEIPATLPPLPTEIANTVVVIGLPDILSAEVAAGLKDRGITLQFHKDGADGITRIRELRQLKVEPFVLMDVDASGITDSQVHGGLETVSTMWELGFRLPVGLLSRRDLPVDLLEKLSAIPGITMLKVDEPPSPECVQGVLDLVLANVRGPGAGETRAPAPREAPAAVPGPPAPAEEYYDIQQEFSEDLEEIDLPLDSWEPSGTIRRQVSMDPHMARLSSYVSELNRQDISGEITLLALRFASAFVSRAVLFLVRKEDLKGLGQFGVELPGGQNADSAVRSLSLPVEENSIFQRVAKNQQSYVGAPTGSGTEKALFTALGGGTPGQIYLGPVISMGKVAVLLYGDDYPGGAGLEPTATMDIFLSHVGLALDRAFLEMKLKAGGRAENP